MPGHNRRWNPGIVPTRETYPSPPVFLTNVVFNYSVALGKLTLVAVPVLREYAFLNNLHQDTKRLFAQAE